MLGEALAVLTALIWAISTILSAEALKTVDPVRSNVIKTFFSTLVMLPLAFAAGEMNSLSDVSLQGLSLVTAAAIIGFGIGDTLLFKSITLVGVSRAYTFAYTYPLFAMVIAVMFLGEPFHSVHLVGTILTVLSITLTVSERDNDRRRASLRGLLMALGTSLTWAVGIALVALGLRAMSALLANALRYPVLSFFLVLVSKPSKGWNLDMKSLVLLSVSGILGMVLGGITSLESIKLIGASRTAPLSASSPVLVSLMSSLFLKERVTGRLLLSSAVLVVGTYFLTV